MVGGVSGGMTGLSGGVKGEGPSEQRVIRTRTREHDHLHGHEGKRTTASASERSKQQERQRAGGRLRTSRVLAGALRQVVAAWCAMVRLRLRLRLRLQPRPQLQLQLRLRLWLRLQLQLRLRLLLRLLHFSEDILYNLGAIYGRGTTPQFSESSSSIFLKPIYMKKISPAQRKMCFISI